MNRITKKFEYLKKLDKKAFISYICAGDPSLDKMYEIINSLEDSGCDIIELGIPFSDPLADGPVIQAASIRSINAGFKIEKFFKEVKKVRKNTEIPLVVMVYYSTIFGFGNEKFFTLCEESGIDGIIIPDLPYEEYDEVENYINKTNLLLIQLIAVTSESRIPMLVEKAKGFIYCVSSLGVTGERKSFDARIDNFINEVKKNTKVPVCVGFGISKREDADRFKKIADGIIVGSAIVRNLYENKLDFEKLKNYIIKEFK